jgi:hypothetical protein
MDNHLLLRVLVRSEPAVVTEEIGSGAVYTSGCWYYRLARSVASPGGGALSQHVAALAPRDQEQVRRDLDALPSAVGLIGWRTIVPVMAALRVRRQLNLLNAEALAIALLTSGVLVVSTDAPLLRSGALDVGVDYQVVT